LAIGDLLTIEGLAIAPFDWRLRHRDIDDCVNRDLGLRLTIGPRPVINRHFPSRQFLNVTIPNRMAQSPIDGSSINRQSSITNRQWDGGRRAAH
jgi:hypothetical protein